MSKDTGDKTNGAVGDKKREDAPLVSAAASSPPSLSASGRKLFAELNFDVIRSDIIPFLVGKNPFGGFVSNLLKLRLVNKRMFTAAHSYFVDKPVVAPTTKVEARLLGSFLDTKMTISKVKAEPLAYDISEKETNLDLYLGVWKVLGGPIVGQNTNKTKLVKFENLPFFQDQFNGPVMS